MAIYKLENMAKFIIYTYQFSPIRNSQKALFSELNVDSDVSMEKKQDIFESLFESNKNMRFSNKSKEYSHKITYKQDNIIVLRLANQKSINIEENFQKHKQNNFPSCLVIIDNRHNVQHIAIEENSIAFTDTQTVATILETTFRRHLKQYKLHIDIQREFQYSEFWDTISRYPDGVTMVRFHFSYPNLPRTWESVDKLIASASETTNSKQTTFEFKSDEEENLELNEKSPMLKGLVKASADTGNVITLKARKFRALIKTGKTTKSIEIDDLEALLTPDLLDINGYQRLAEKLNKIK